MQKRAAGLAGMMMAMPLAAAVAAPRADLHGIAPGMTVAEVMAGAHLPCQIPPYSSDIACRDATDGSDYQAVFSGGTPSVVLTVARSFCDPAPPASVLDRMLRGLDAPRNSAVPDPNGYHVDLDAETELILNADDGICPAGRGRRYVLSLRSDALIQASSHQALDRAKKALR